MIVLAHMVTDNSMKSGSVPILDRKNGFQIEDHIRIQDRRLPLTHTIHNVAFDPRCGLVGDAVRGDICAAHSCSKGWRQTMGSARRWFARLGQLPSVRLFAVHSGGIRIVFTFASLKSLTDPTLIIV